MGIFSKNPRISFPVNMSPKVVQDYSHLTVLYSGYYDAQPGQDWGGWQGEGRGRGGRGRGRGGGRGRGEGGRGRGGRGRGRGGRGGGQREPAEENPWLSVMNAMGDTGDGNLFCRCLWYQNFFPPNAFLRRRRKKALLRVNDRGGGWKMCILALCRVYVRTCARAAHVCS